MSPSSTATSLKREADASNGSADAKRTRHVHTEVATDSCIAERATEAEATAAEMNAGVIKHLDIKVNKCITKFIQLLCTAEQSNHLY
jgi:hypothetical protein